MDEFELMKQIQQMLDQATPEQVKRTLSYLSQWNTARPLPPAGDK